MSDEVLNLSGRSQGTIRPNLRNVMAYSFARHSVVPTYSRRRTHWSYWRNPIAAFSCSFQRLSRVLNPNRGNRIFSSSRRLNNRRARIELDPLFSPVHTFGSVPPPAARENGRKPRESPQILGVFLFFYNPPHRVE